MKNINFTSKFTADKSFYKITNIPKDDKYLKNIKTIVESSVFTELSNNDTISISASKKHSKETVLLKYGNSLIEISGAQNIQRDILIYIMLYTCIKNGKRPLSFKFERVLNCFLNLVKDK